MIAGERVKRAHPEENGANHEERDVEHGGLLAAVSRRTRRFDPISDQILSGRAVYWATKLMGRT